jgi:chromosomal replication initiation ATPase DnaA
MTRLKSQKTLKNNDHSLYRERVFSSHSGGHCARSGLKEKHAQIAEMIGGVVACSLRVPPGDMFAQTRCHAHTALARQIAIYLLHTGMGLSLNQVAPLFKRDRTTAAHACRRIEELRDDNQMDVLLCHLERGVDALRPLVFAEEAGR